jgi:hypothetical protein
MPKQLAYDYVKTLIESKGDILISPTYNTSNTLLDIVCGICNKDYKQTISRFKMGYQHAYCLSGLPFDGYKKQIILKPILCGICKKEFQPKSSKTQFCSRECADNNCRTDEYKARAFLNGQKGGKVSATSKSRRSKNEIYFSELCANDFEITTNEPYFDGWDADIIIHSDKTAILWNGIWHYKQIMKSQSLKQVQTRDKIKTAIIEKYGYIPYVIKDMGKYNKAFVEQEYEIFKLMRMDV